MANKYKPAPEVQAVADELIAKHHHHLMSVKILYLFCDKPETVRGSQALGTARKVTGLPAYLNKLGAGPQLSFAEISGDVHEKRQRQAA